MSCDLEGIATTAVELDGLILATLIDGVQEMTVNLLAVTEECSTMAEQSIKIYRGENRTIRVTVKDETGELVNLTGGIAYFRVKKDLADNVAVISKSSVTPSEITLLTQSGSTLGQFEVYLVPTDTSTLIATVYKYDCWFVNSTGKRYAVVGADSFQVQRAVTEL